VQGPDKSGTRLWKPVKRFWKLVISQGKSGETLEKGFWMVKHLLDLSPNIFDASLLIVWLFCDSNKIKKIFNLQAFDSYPFLFSF
jgi:hypothetical protein